MENKKSIGGAAVSVRDAAGYLLAGLSVLMLIKSLMLCFGKDIWYDELFTVGLAQHSWGELIALTAADVHPPLYYMIVKLAIDLCKLISASADAVIIAKIVSVVPYFILLLYSLTFIRKRFGMLTGGLFLFCVTAMPQMSAYTVEMRMYSWALLFVTAAYLHAYGAVAAGTGGVSGVPDTDGGDDGAGGAAGTAKSRRLHMAAFAVYGIAAAYTQYFACVAVVMVYLYVLAVFLLRDRRRIREWFLCAALSAVCYVPWLFALAGQIASVGENYWILPLTWRSLGGCVKFLMKPAFANDTVNVVLAVVLTALYGAVFIYAASKLFHYGRVIEQNGIKMGHTGECVSPERDAAWHKAAFLTAGVGVLAGLVLFGFAASVIFRPVFVYRYMLPALGCFWFAYALAVGISVEYSGGSKDASGDQDIPGAPPVRIQRHGAAVGKMIMALVCVLTVIAGLRDYRAFMDEEEYKTLLMQDTSQALAQIGEDDILIFNFDQVQMVVGYYVNNDSYLWYGEPEQLIQEISGDKQSMNEDTEQIKTWLAEGRKVRFLGSFNSREDIVQLWREAGLRVTETGSYLLERYWFNLYDVERE